MPEPPGAALVFLLKQNQPVQTFCLAVNGPMFWQRGRGPARQRTLNKLARQTLPAFDFA